MFPDLQWDQVEFQQTFQKNKKKLLESNKKMKYYKCKRNWNTQRYFPS